MNIVYIIFKNGEVTTIKSRIALTIATSFLDEWFDLNDFKTVVSHDDKHKVFYLVEKGFKEGGIIWL